MQQALDMRARSVIKLAQHRGKPTQHGPKVAWKIGGLMIKPPNAPTPSQLTVLQNQGQMSTYKISTNPPDR